MLEFRLLVKILGKVFFNIISIEINYCNSLKSFALVAGFFSLRLTVFLSCNHFYSSK